ncbi:hypothetical protein AB0L82_42955 [Nocardia sp. NPDC052001]|uniref:hypothetical protein n=1 Tax=Nocardia sp. NPDC052001 TaxID=3154853 RepID=UPI0034142A95
MVGVQHFVIAGSIAAAMFAGAVGTAAADPGGAWCSGNMCYNESDAPALATGDYTCPSGLVFPSFAIVPPRTAVPIFPARCS